MKLLCVDVVAIIFIQFYCIMFCTTVNKVVKNLRITQELAFSVHIIEKNAWFSIYSEAVRQVIKMCEEQTDSRKGEIMLPK